MKKKDPFSVNNMKSLKQDVEACCRAKYQVNKQIVLGQSESFLKSSLRDLG